MPLNCLENQNVGWPRSNADTSPMTHFCNTRGLQSTAPVRVTACGLVGSCATLTASASIARPHLRAAAVFKTGWRLILSPEASTLLPLRED